MAFEKFIKIFTPDEKCAHLDKSIVDKYRNKVPEALLDLWKKNGVGKYGDGIIEIVNPEEYSLTLETWLGKKVPNYVPLAISAFGNLYYFRKLSEEDEDVCVIDTQYGLINTCVWSIDSFFNEYLTNDDTINNELNKQLFYNSIKKLGPLEVGQMFLFEPALCVGGAKELEYVNKGNAVVHLDLLLQM